MSMSSLSAPGFVAGIVIGLALGVLSALFLPHIPLLQHASAQLPDPGAQRNLLHQDLVSLNEKMDQLITLFRSGQVKVNCQQADNKKPGVVPHDMPEPDVPNQIPTTGTDRKGRNPR